MANFTKEYWDTQYNDIQTLDGVGNAKDHSRYLSAFFNIEGFNVESMIDLGFGTGHLFKEMYRKFQPHRVVGIEPSTHVFKKFKASWARTHQMDLLEWSRVKDRSSYDLGLCTSVLQYLTDKELKEAIPVMSRRIRYLYLTVPTDIEYSRQSSELKFSDPYAKQRTRKQYQNLLLPHFTFLSMRVLESKIFYDERTTPFNDLLFRF